eukprot:GHVR01136459.1.p1 GENE.GHVR01136459.1~~GHVR01136459.1.p1  ORF type:complete len:120 (+),score=4.80 GHVR01136459.1:1170-1529(+)
MGQVIHVHALMDIIKTPILYARFVIHHAFNVLMIQHALHALHRLSNKLMQSLNSVNATQLIPSMQRIIDVKIAHIPVQPVNRHNQLNARLVPVQYIAHTSITLVYAINITMMMAQIRLA